MHVLFNLPNQRRGGGGVVGAMQVMNVPPPFPAGPDCTSIMSRARRKAKSI